MFELYFSSCLAWGVSEEKIFEKAAELGFSGIEFFAQQLELYGISPAELKRLSARYNKTVTVHNYSWDTNLSSLNKDITKVSVELTKKAVDIALTAGAGELTVHPGHKSFGGDGGQCCEIMHEALGEIYAYGIKRGIIISLEIMEKIPLEIAVCENSIEKAAGLFYDKYHYTVDTAHCDTKEEIFHLADKLPAVSKFHISNRKGNRLHTPIYDGDYDFKSILPELKKYNIPVVIEGFDKSGDFSILKNSTKYLKTMEGLLL